MLRSHLVSSARTALLACWCALVSLSSTSAVELKIATFQVDATPPLGAPLCDALVPPAEAVDDPLSARGIVLLPGGHAPVLLVAVDWVGIGNEGHDVWRQALADAVGTTIERVAVHTLHQHDAPGCDFAAERIAAQAGLDGELFPVEYARQTIDHVAKAAREAIEHPQRATHVAWGRGKVEQVASNRRLLGSDGKVQHVRFSSCADADVRALPEGLVDPYVRSVSFWDGAKPLVALTYYATHPQSYYGAGRVSADFVGMARGIREQALPGVPHIHFNGAGGNVAAGKYNDGSKERRPELARRLAQGMEDAWIESVKTPLATLDFAWDLRQVKLPTSRQLDKAESQTTIANPDAPRIERLRAVRDLAWIERTEADRPIDVARLRLGALHLLHMPGELFVEYQLAAQALCSSGFVCMAAYGDYGPGYIGTSEAYPQGGYETGRVSRVAPRVEQVLTTAIDQLVGDAPREVPAVRIGVIGLDTSHVIHFTKLINDPSRSNSAGCRITAAFPEGSRDIESSVSRIPGYTQQLREMGVAIVPSIDVLLEQVDAVLLETNDGRPHLAQALPVLRAQKRLFIDKPMAGSLSDVIALFDAAEHYKTPLFSTSSLRYGKKTLAARQGSIGKILGCDVFGPCSLEPTHPDFFWYGIHGVEALVAVMGEGCETVTRVTTPDQDLAVGLWSEGRVGSFRGMRGGVQQYGGLALGETGNTEVGTYDGYEPLVDEILKFFRGAAPPVTREETIEVFAFMEAADESKRQGGRPAAIAPIISRAREAARKKRTWVQETQSAGEPSTRGKADK